jgi:hypothetical protein
MEIALLLNESCDRAHITRVDGHATCFLCLDGSKVPGFDLSEHVSMYEHRGFAVRNSNGDSVVCRKLEYASFKDCIRNVNASVLHHSNQTNGRNVRFVEDTSASFNQPTKSTAKSIQPFQIGLVYPPHQRTKFLSVSLILFLFLMDISAIFRSFVIRF